MESSLMYKLLDFKKVEIRRLLLDRRLKVAAESETYFILLKLENFI